jgi:hypothetical protein
MYKTTINKKEVFGTYEYLVSLTIGFIGHKIERVK